VPKTPYVSPYVCARHSKATKDTRIAGLFFCDECAELFKEKVFEVKDPEFVYAEIQGYCAYCGQDKPVRERFWYLCNICERIVRSYASERAASAFVSAWWEDLQRRSSVLRDVRLDMTDPVKLMSFRAHKTWKETRKFNPDFTAFRGSSTDPLFGVEMKTGRSAIPDMSMFQLDVSDCDDILGWVKPLVLPAFLFHIQVTEDFRPPTSRRAARDGWYIDVFEMEQNFKGTRQRSGENRPAAYFNRKGFHPLQAFGGPNFLQELEKMKNKLEHGMPQLYELPLKTPAKPEASS